MIVHVSPLFTQRNGCPYVHIKTCLAHFKFPTITTLTDYLIPADITLGHRGQRVIVGGGEVGQGKATLAQWMGWTPSDKA